MHLFVTIPLGGDGSPVAPGIRGVITDLFSSASPFRDGDYFFVRTWDRETAGDCFQLSLDSGGIGSPEAAELVQQAVKNHGFRPTIHEVPFTEIPSPLWNSGLGGAEFDAVSKRLYRSVAPTLVECANALRGDANQDYPLALRLMVAHAAATLLESEQKELSSFSFAELFSLRLLSYRSHYEGVYASAKDPESFENRYAAYYARSGAIAREFVAARLASPMPAEHEGPVRAWVDAIRANFAEVRDCFRQGLIVNEGPSPEDFAKSAEGSLRPTRFHSLESAALNKFLHRNDDFLAYRLQTSLLYSCLYTLGFNLVERYLFCYTLARANEDVAGKSTSELQQELRALATQLSS